MIETPAAALLADQLAAECDFLSIGSNDLSQYTLAMDRMHPLLATRLDGLHPAVLRLIERATRAGAAGNIETAVCGNLASDPVALPVLIGLGVRELSVVPAQIPRLKGLVRTLEIAACADLARRALACVNASEVRTLVREWSEQRV
jgi:phosphoenolpyruvate-protein kinase (PTS system EI component)